MTQMQLAKCVGVSRPAVTQWETGNTKSLEGENLLKTATCLKVRAEWLLSGKGAMPAAVEGVKEKRPVYQQSDLQAEKDVPLIDWREAGRWLGAETEQRLEQVEDWLPCPDPHSRRTFAVRVCGISMEPEFREGEIIYVDPERQADHKSYVVVRLQQSHEASLKQLIVESGRRYLKALNPNWPDAIIDIQQEAVIVGVVIGKYKKY